MSNLEKIQASKLIEALRGAMSQMALASDCIENNRLDEALLHVNSMNLQRREAIAEALGVKDVNLIDRAGNLIENTIFLSV